MSKYFERVKDITMYCPICDKTVSGYIGENDDLNDVACPYCKNENVEIKSISNTYEISN